MTEHDLTPPRENLLKPGALWPRVTQQTQHALACGALQSIATGYEFVEQNQVRFLVRILVNLLRKDEAEQKQKQASVQSGQRVNPFLPYDPNLFVAHLSPTHLCLLNKFNVVDHHLLIITRAFEEQANWLTLADFEALWVCMNEIDGLAFYNGGKLAGASQRHKHLQLVPLPLAPAGGRIPIEPLFATATFQDSIGTVPELPFVHAIARLNPNWLASPQAAAKATLECYQALLQAVGLSFDSTDPKQSAPYNWLATREWMFLVPRSQEAFDAIAVNSLGFAGALLVRNQEQLQRLKAHSPMTILQQVAIAKEPVATQNE
ncbi:phosphorylase [Oculatella sp. LEGE 06141]|uniref:ATP adenylyltransferase family protein n=1 Tax=Oculatella sp. LEGE 06141 TaxID=1828648 RepID=UPI001881D68B|nr:phosphorylase [Oculatella sp. LEGE 06141]MBE9178035.1 phosphorylase [Oculatella sp. LEGE 06141]